MPLVVSNPSTTKLQSFSLSLSQCPLCLCGYVVFFCFRDRIASMKRAFALVGLLFSATGLAQPKVDVAAALKAVTPDLAQRLARFKPVKMPYNPSGLSQRERDMVEQLVIACRELESMYWRQSDPE